MITIKCYGQGCWMHLLASSEDALNVYKTFATKMKLPLEEALLDAWFYQYFNNKIQGIEDLIADTFGGLVHKQHSVIEVWFNRKKLVKISVNELVNTTTLFPLYAVKKIELTRQDFEKGIYLKETVIGCVGVYKMPTDQFDIEKLTFTLLSSDFLKPWMLVDFSYEENSFQKVKEDCLTKHQEIIIV